jgi:two-component system, cell cycle response regulator
MALAVGKQVILIDPSEEREVLADRLRVQGYLVTVTPDPAVGASLALADPPAAVVADLWTPGISGVQLCRLLRAEPATQHVPTILRGPDQDQHSRFWADRAGAASYVGQGRMGELVRALAEAISKRPPEEDVFFQLSGGEPDIRDRIAAYLDNALFESVIAAEVRALSVCETFARLFDLLSQFVSRVTSYRWLAVHTDRRPRLAVHCHPSAREAAVSEARAALIVTDDVPITTIEDRDAHDDPSGATPIVASITLGQDKLGRLALAVREQPHPKDAELVAVIARELGGPIRIASLVEESQRQAATDPLTGLMNRRSFKAASAMEIARSERHGYPLCALLLDVDHFKEINDKRGHAAGDIVLAHLGRLLTGEIRKVDFAGRWGGEEFVVLLSGSDRDGGLLVAERIRNAVASTRVEDEAGEPIPVTVSIGSAVYYAGEGIESLLGRADAGMYLAKSAGRNRVMLGPDGPQAAPVDESKQPAEPPAPTPILAANGR